jgi:uncharacterized membrane protein YeaQ/YmgE (transglycosylase-associated protein family)
MMVMVNVGAWLLVGALLGVLVGLSLDHRQWRMLPIQVVPGISGAGVGGWLGGQGAENPAVLDGRALVAAVLGAALLLLWTHWRRIRQA